MVTLGDMTRIINRLVLSRKGQASGFASLGVDGKVPAAELPPGQGGEANTASNVGVAGVGVFKQKTGINLEFKKLNIGSSKVIITDDAGNSEVDLDVDANAIVAASTDSRLSDARTPIAHTTSHQSGGSDAIKLDDLAAPDDNPDLNASTAKHGLLPKLSGVATEFLNGIGGFSLPSLSGANIKQTEVDFGTTPTYEKSFSVVDTDVLITSQLIGLMAYEAPTGRDLDEVEMEPFNLRVGPGVEQLTIWMQALEGPVIGKYKLNYLIG